VKRHQNQIASTLALAATLIVAIAPALFLPLLQAQSRAAPKGVDPKLLVKAEAGDAIAQLLVGVAYWNGD
jgi:hypothetical protein